MTKRVSQYVGEGPRRASRRARPARSPVGGASSPAAGNGLSSVESWGEGATSPKMLLGSKRPVNPTALALADDGTLTSEAALVTLRAGAAAAVSGEAPVARLACVPGEIYPGLVPGGIQEP